MPDQVTPDVWQLASIDEARVAHGVLYEEFLTIPDLSAGLYVLEAGAIDPQVPHTEDELYYVVAGSGRITVDGATHDVSTGAVVFVAAHADHRFHDVTERLELLVVFGPAEGSRA